MLNLNFSSLYRKSIFAALFLLAVSTHFAALAGPPSAVDRLSGKLKRDLGLDDLIQLLGNSDPHLRMRAALAVRDFEENGEPAVDALLLLLHDPNNDVRSTAVDALREMKLPGSASKTLLGLVENDPDESVRAYAAFALRNLPAYSDEMVEILGGCVEAASQSKSINASNYMSAILTSLGAISKRSGRGRDLMIDIFLGEPAVDDYSHGVAAQSLLDVQDLRKYAARIILAVDWRRLVKKPLHHVTVNDVKTLSVVYKATEQPDIGFYLERVVSSHLVDDVVRMETIGSLQSIRNETMDGRISRHLLKILDRWRNGDDGVSRSARASMRFFADRREASQNVIDAILDSIAVRNDTANDAIRTLGEIGPSALNAVPILERKVLTKDPRTRFLAAVSLWKINRDKATVLPMMLELLQTKNEGSDFLYGFRRKRFNARVRADAASFLGTMGVGPLEVVPALFQCRDDEFFAVRDAAEKSISTIIKQASD